MKDKWCALFRLFMSKEGDFASDLYKTSFSLLHFVEFCEWPVLHIFFTFDIIVPAPK